MRDKIDTYYKTWNRQLPAEERGRLQAEWRNETYRIGHGGGVTPETNEENSELIRMNEEHRKLIVSEQRVKALVNVRPREETQPLLDKCSSLKSDFTNLDACITNTERMQQESRAELRSRDVTVSDPGLDTYDSDMDFSGGE